MKRKTAISTVLYSLLGIFLLIVTYFVIDEEIWSAKNDYFIVLAILGFLFLVLGCILLCLAKKEKKELKTYMLIAGISSIAPLICVVLHNGFYALAIMFETYSLIFNFLEGFFFILGLLVAPISFLIGLIGSLVILNKK